MFNQHQLRDDPSQNRGGNSIRNIPGMIIGRRAIEGQTMEFIILGLTLAVSVLFAVFVDGFFNWGNFEVIAYNSAALTILSCGMAIVIIAGGLDLSQVAVMMTAAAVFGILLNSGYNYGIALAAALSVAIVLGILNGILIAYIEISSMLATLATALLIQGVGRWWFMKGAFIRMLPKDAPILRYLSTGKLFSIPVTVVIGLIILGLTHFILSKTVLGRLFYAMGENFNTARLTGLSVRTGTVAVYIIAAITALIAGVMIGSSSGTIDFRIASNSMLLFEVITVVVLGGISLRGGRGSVFSIIVGVMLISVLRNGITLMNLSSQVQDLIRGLVLILAIVIDNIVNPRDAETDTQGDL